MAIPTDIAGLILWLKADAITGLADGAEVATWLDSSGAGNNFRESTFNAGFDGPKYQTNELNGLPIVRFDADSEGMHGVAPLVLAHPYTILYVAKSNDAGSASRRIVDSNSTNWLMGPYAGLWQWFSGGFATAGPSSTGGAWIIHGLRARTATGTHYVWPLTNENGPASGTRASPTAIGTVNLGMGGSSEPANSDLAELIIYNNEISDSNRDALVAYLRYKWAAVGNPPATSSNRMSNTGSIRHHPQSR